MDQADLSRGFKGHTLELLYAHEYARGESLGTRLSLPRARSFAQFSMSQRSNDCARGEPGDEATVLVLQQAM